MALENLVGADKFLSALVPANPVGGDDRREGDDHIRGVKNTLRNTFPNLTGAVTATQAELSSVTSKVNRAGDTMTGTLAINVGGPTDAQVRTVTTNTNFGFGSNVGTPGPCWNIYDGLAAKERLRIDGAGRLGVGDVVPDAAGHVVKAAGSYTLLLLPTPGTGSGLIVSTAASAAGAFFAVFARDAAPLGSIVQTGTTGVAYNTSSDYRLKNITGPLEGSGAFIDALLPRQGTWKASGAPFVGFVAHELQAVSPGSVTGEKDAIDAEGAPMLQQVAYSSAELIANIVAELQSVRARLAELES